MILNQPAEIGPRREAEHPVAALERLRRRVLVVTTLGYIGCFAVWTIFAIIGVEIQRQYGLSDTEFGLLVGAPFLSGSLMRVLLGVWADRHGGRRLFLGVMIIAAVATWFLADATSLSDDTHGGARHRHCRGLLRRRTVVYHAVVSERTSRHGPGHIGRGQCGLGDHQARRPLGHARLWLAGRRSSLGAAAAVRRRGLLARLG